jgi:hypothetical protein
MVTAGEPRLIICIPYTQVNFGGQHSSVSPVHRWISTTLSRSYTMLAAQVQLDSPAYSTHGPNFFGKFECYLEFGLDLFCFASYWHWCFMCTQVILMYALWHWCYELANWDCIRVLPSFRLFTPRSQMEFSIFLTQIQVISSQLSHTFCDLLLSILSQLF